MKFFTAFLILVLCCSMVQARNYYVSKGSNGTGSMTSPYGTIAQAARVAAAGDTVFIAGGTYSEMNIKPTKSGSLAGGMIVYTVWPETGEVIITKEKNGSEDENTPVFDLGKLSYIWVQHLTFSNMKYLCACVSLSGSSHCVITHCRFLNLGREEVAPAWDGTSMVWLNGAQDCVVSNCYFNHIYGDAINFYGQNTKRNLFFGNTFVDLQGKKRSWDTAGGRFSSAITGTDNSFGDNILCFNHITKGYHGLWMDRDASRNILVRNFGNGGQTLVFNESRCAANWIQENVAINMTDAAYRSASYDGTNWSFDTRYINNVAYKCKYGFYLHKSKHNEVRNNIGYNCSEYAIVLTDSAYKYGQNLFRNNLWRSTTKPACVKYRGKEVTASTFAKGIGETGGIYQKTPAFQSLGTAPEGYMQKETSCCVGAGDGGIDMGAYPVYRYADMGTDTSRVAGSVQPYFDRLVTDALRGEEYTLIIRLPKAAKERFVVKVIPVAGDAISGYDYEMKDSLLAFEPGEISRELKVRFIGEETDCSKLLLLRLCREDNIAYEGRSYAAFRLMTRAEYESLQNSDLYLEAEDGVVGSLWQVLSDSKASGGKYVMVKGGNNSSGNAPSEAKGWVDIQFHVTRPTTYVLWLRTICPNANDDSFWLRMDNEEWAQWNDIPASSLWQWNRCPRTYTLLEGQHTLHVGYREDGAKLDKLMLSCIGTTPEGMGIETGLAIPGEEAQEVVATTYYDLSGRPVSPLTAKGIVIKRVLMSNGAIKSEKVHLR